jgi:hypothetical protein
VNRVRIVQLRRWALALLACPLAASAADATVTVTLLEGPATLIRGVTRYALAEGVRLQPGDILEVSEKGLAEMEFADGVALALGPKTRVLALSVPHGKPAPGEFYATQGTLKLAGLKQGARFRLLTPVFVLQPVEGTVVLALGNTEGSVFVETGEARLAGRSARGAAPMRLKSGDFYTAGENKGGVAGRPSPAFIAALPKAFLDPLPSRLARYKDRQAQPRPLEPVKYAEVETWLKAPPEIRRPMPARFHSRAADPAFRAALVENLKFHPEWDPILFPEKYQPKETEADSGRGTAVPPRPADKR